MSIPYTDMAEYEIRHIRALRGRLAECTVLLKKDGSFPLKRPCAIAAYGSGVRGTVKGGTGSGEVNSRCCVTIEEGLRDAGFAITTTAWLDQYEQHRATAHERFEQELKAAAKAANQNYLLYSMGKAMPEPEYDLPLNGSGNAAIYVISRISGEGSDRAWRKGDILLTDSEVRDILALNQTYERFMLVLNVGGVVDLTPVMEVRNILLLSQLGAETGSVLADILLGKANPSGKLTTTWAAQDCYPPMPDFEDRDNTRYREGIYIGYRYFDAFDKMALFPFGYGLSYTNFRVCDTASAVNGETVTVSATVENIGEYPGKQVIQVYLSKPVGKLDQPRQKLCAFAKTRELLPGEQETLHTVFSLSDMAAYDAERGAYLLEAGRYIVSVGTDSRSMVPVAALHLTDTVVTAQVKNVPGHADFDDLVSIPARKELPEALPTFEISHTAFTPKQVVYGGQTEILPEVDALRVEDAALLNLGCFDPNAQGLASMIGAASTHVCGAAGETSDKVNGFPFLVMADGPAGLRLTAQCDDRKTHQYCTALPIGTALAQSFNVDFARLCGDIVGKEMQRFGVQLWLAPALNIHRSVRCGRNFEYYSEDPLLSGKMAAAITNGVQAHNGCGVTIKHFAANNKELNRNHNNSIVSERALREIYLKGFAICVREAQPKAVMTSYNLLNGIHTAENRALIEDILRAEFGHQGIVMTDWVVTILKDATSAHRDSQPPQTAAAGCDLFMPGCKRDYQDLLQGIADGLVTPEQIKINATRVLKLARQLTGD